MTEIQKEKWLRFYFDETHGSSQGEELLALIDGVRDEALEEAAKALDAEADKMSDKARIELSQGNHEMVVYHCSIQGSIQHDAELVRALKAKP